MCWPSNVSNITFGVVDLGTFRVDKIFMGIPYLLVLYVAELGHAGIIRAAKGWGDPFESGGRILVLGCLRERVTGRIRAFPARQKSKLDAVQPTSTIE